MSPRIKVTVTDELTHQAITGAKVKLEATGTGQSNAKARHEFDDDDAAREEGVLASGETVPLPESSAKVAFEVADWVTKLDITAEHDRFEDQTTAIRPSTSDTEVNLSLPPKTEDTNVTVSEYFPEPALVELKPADPVTEKVYPTEGTTLEIAPGTDEMLTLLQGRYKFELENPPENYTGELTIATNLEAPDPADIVFSGMDIDEEERQRLASSDPSPENDESSSEGGRFSFGVGLFSSDDNSEDDTSPVDPVPDAGDESSVSDESHDSEGASSEDTAEV